MDAIGMDAIGMAETGAAAIGTAIGTVITVTIMLSSSATSAFPAGGAGAGAPAGAGDILTDTTATVIRTTGTAMVMGIPATDTAIMGMDTAMEIVDNTAPLPGQEERSWRADSRAAAAL